MRELEIPLDVLDRIEEVLTPTERFNDKDDERPHVAIYVAHGDWLKFVGVV